MSITQIGLSVEDDWKRSDLVYAERLTKQSDQVIGTAENGITAIKANVMNAAFRTPDLTERVAALEVENAEIKIDNAALVLRWWKRKADNRPFGKRGQYRLDWEIPGMYPE